MEKFRKMRKKTSLTKKECENILKRNYFMTLSTKLENGWTYLITLNYLFKDNSLYFHCAKEGQKIDAFAYDPRVCISIVDEAKIIHELASIRFKSVIIYGIVEKIKNINIVKNILRNLVKKYCGGLSEAIEFREKNLDKMLGITAVFHIKIKHITGKYFPEQ